MVHIWTFQSSLVASYACSVHRLCSWIGYIALMLCVHLHLVNCIRCCGAIPLVSSPSSYFCSCPTALCFECYGWIESLTWPFAFDHCLSLWHYFIALELNPVTRVWSCVCLWIFIGYIITVVARQCTQAWTAATRYWFYWYFFCFWCVDLLCNACYSGEAVHACVYCSPTRVDILIDVFNY